MQKIREHNKRRLKGKKVKVAANEGNGSVEKGLANAEPVEVSSPVCYANSPGLREGFGEGS